MAVVTDELKRKRAEIGVPIEDLRKQIAILEQQQAAFEIVVRSYEPDYSPEAVNSKNFERRGFVFRMLRQAGRPITAADFATAFAREKGLGEYAIARSYRQPLIADARSARQG